MCHYICHHFLASTFCNVSRKPLESLQSLEIYLLAYIKFVGLVGALGASFTISLAADLLNATTLHLYLFYLIAAKLHSWQVKAILSLFNLFRGMFSLMSLQPESLVLKFSCLLGQRQNPLRKRIDAADYDLDQLLLGTILFTVLIFLFPTVAVYYLLFYMVCLHSRLLFLVVSNQ